MAISAAAFALFITINPSSAADNSALVVPAAFTSNVAMKRQAFFLSRKAEPAATVATTPAEATPALTSEFLAAYVARQQALESFDVFEAEQPQAELTEAVLLGYIAKRRNDALEAIENVDVTAKPALTPDILTAYAAKDFVPTAKKVKLAEGEKLCLAQAIYHEARGESREGQLAVANVIINRAMSKKYPSTICGVVFQNADKGRYKCQFTFACDGRSDMGSERRAWNRAIKMAETAFYEFKAGETPGIVPDGTLYYHTTAVAPRWSHAFRRVAAIGSHVFYSPN